MPGMSPEAEIRSVHGELQQTPTAWDGIHGSSWVQIPSQFAAFTTEPQTLQQILSSVIPEAQSVAEDIAE